MKQRLLKMVIPAVLAAFVGLAAPSVARADEFTDRANSMYVSIPRERRSDLILLPALASIQPPPASAATLEQAVVMPADASGFEAAATWAKASQQAAVLQALKTITTERDWRKAMVFALPYGAEGVAPEMIAARLYVELGDPQTLAAAQLYYLEKLDIMKLLVMVEATRLAAEGKPSEAIDLLTSLVMFGRQMSDRNMVAEAAWGMNAMAHAYERIRDIAYVDSREGKKLDLSRLRAQIDALSTTGGFLDIGRITLPAGDMDGVDQIVARVYAGGNNIDPRVFAGTLARLGATKHPLRLFSEEARWRNAGANQANKVDAERVARGIRADWQRRWGLPKHDRLLRTSTVASSLDREKYAAIEASLKDYAPLFDLRTRVEVESNGTRQALALVGHWYTTKILPVTISACRPLWIERLEIDPLNDNLRDGNRPPFEYFVPIRDARREPGKQPEPLEVSIFSPPRERFGLRLRDDVFVMYSIGTDLRNNFARRIQNTTERVEGADYLIWPPTVSLYRQHLRDMGEIK